MSLTVKSSGNGDFEITPEGTYIGRCIKVIDLGTQTTTGQFGTKSQHQVMITWELLDNEVKMQDGRPFAASQFYTASLHEKAKLRKDLEAWRGKKFTDEELEGFDLNNVLGAYCMLQVVHSQDGQYANVNAIMSFKGNKPVGVNELVVFDISNPDMAVFETLSDKMKAKIMAAPEWGTEEGATNDVVQEVNEAFPGAEEDTEPAPDDFLK
jgi:hypothetical protein